MRKLGDQQIAQIKNHIGYVAMYVGSSSVCCLNQPEPLIRAVHVSSK